LQCHSAAQQHKLSTLPLISCNSEDARPEGSADQLVLQDFRKAMKIKQKAREFLISQAEKNHLPVAS